MGDTLFDMGDEPARRLLQSSASRQEVAAMGSASQCLGTITPGMRVVGLTKGQFSLLDIIRALLAQTGPAHLAVSTWSTGIRDADNVAWLLSTNDLLSFRLLVDRSFELVNERNAKVVKAKFGDEFIRSSNVHCKFFLLYNDDWHFVCRSSMNLNRNPRFEQFDLDDDLDLFGFFDDFLAEIWREAKPGMFASRAVIDPPFHRSFGGQEVEVAETTTDDLMAGVSALRADLAKASFD